MKNLNNLASKIRGLIKVRILILMLFAPVLWSCAAFESQQAINASDYLFDLDVTIDPQLVAEYEFNVAKGAGSGLLRGAWMGAGGCIVSLASGDPTIVTGAALGILISPFCAVAGAFVGGATAETEEDVTARVKALNEMLAQLNYPSGLDLARLVKNDLLKSRSSYRFSESSGNIQQIGDAIVAEPDEAGNTTPALAVGAKEEDNSFQNFSVVARNAEAPEKPKVNVDSKPHPTQPNASISLNITNYSLSGFGVNPVIKLQISATICIKEYASGEVVLFQPLTVKSGLVKSAPKKLEEWAALKKEEFEAVTLALVQWLTADIIDTVGRKRVRANSKLSCLS